MTGVGGQGALRALPAPEDDPLVSAIRAMLPERSVEDRARGEVPISFGTGDASKTIRIPALTSKPNRAWQETFKEKARGLFAELEADDTGAVMVSLLTGATDFQLDLLEAYNAEHMGRAHLEANASDEQILDNFLQVTAAAFPLPFKLGRVLLANRQVAQWIRLELVRLLYSRSTSSSPPNGGGSPPKSKKH